MSMGLSTDRSTGSAAAGVPLRAGLTPATLARFERRMSGPRPDFSGGVRFLGVERMSNYVRCRPYTRYLERTIAELA